MLGLAAAEKNMDLCRVTAIIFGAILSLAGRLFLVLSLKVYVGHYNHWLFSMDFPAVLLAVLPPAAMKVRPPVKPHAFKKKR